MKIVMKWKLYILHLAIILVSVSVIRIHAAPKSKRINKSGPIRLDAEIVEIWGWSVRAE